MSRTVKSDESTWNSNASNRTGLLGKIEETKNNSRRGISRLVGVMPSIECCMGQQLLGSISAGINKLPFDCFAASLALHIDFVMRRMTITMEYGGMEAVLPKNLITINKPFRRWRSH